MGYRQRQAGESAASVYMNSARAALALIATFLRAIQAEMLTKRVKQRGAVIQSEGVLVAVDKQF